MALLWTRKRPNALGQSLTNELSVVFRCRGHFSPVTPFVAEPTSSHDVFRNIFAAIASRTKVFRGAPG